MAMRSCLKVANTHDRLAGSSGRRPVQQRRGIQQYVHGTTDGPLCFTLRAHRLVQGDCLSVSGGVGDSRARERQNGEKGGADLGIAGMRRRWGGGLQGS